jgi:large subunit ribosomal protein L25
MEFELNAEKRNESGTPASRKDRHAGQVPGVVYGGGKKTVSIVLKHDELRHNLDNEAFYSHVLSLNIAGKTEKVILRDIQRHPSKPRILHLDLQRIKEDEKIRVFVPLHFLGEDVAPGVKLEGGTVSHLITEVEVLCLPADLPEYIEIDISTMELGAPLHLSEINMPESVEIVEFAHGEDAQDKPVVLITKKRGAASEIEPEEQVEGEGEEVEGEGEAAEGDPDASDSSEAKDKPEPSENN